MMAARLAMSRGARRAAAYSARQAFRSAARAASRVGRYAKVTARRNPMTAGFMAGGAAENLFRGAKKRNLKSIRQGRIVKPRKAGPVPSAPSSRVPAKYAVAPRMTKFSKEKVTAQKVPKSAIVHYKEFGQFTAEKCMYINHEHWGHVDKFWRGIGYGLTKLLLPYAKIYNAKSMEDPCIGPRTNVANPAQQYGDRTSATKLRLVYLTEAADGSISRAFTEFVLENIVPTPDVYKSFDAIAQEVTDDLKVKYTQSANKTWLIEAQFLIGDDTANDKLNAQPIYIQNLDDAEINLYVHSLVKFQNVTPSDGTSLDKHQIDANPLIGRVYTAKAHKPEIDSDLLSSGDKTLDTFFGAVNDSTLGITLLGHGNFHTADDLGRISHIPNARELYGNQHVKSGQIYMAAGSMKFHKTTFTMKKTFRALSDLYWWGTSLPAGSAKPITSHTMFGFTLQHKHGEDSINIGYNRDTDVGCYVKHKRVVHPLKTNYTLDSGVIATTIVPTEHQ